MSYRNRRQSIYLQRNSITRTNSYDAATRKQLIDNGGSGGGQWSIPTPDLKQMKVYKGYEFVTWKPVEIRPPPFSSETDSTLKPAAIVDTVDSGAKNADQDDDLDDDDSPPQAEIMDARVAELDSEWITSLGCLDQISEQESRECLCKQVDQKCCYGTKAAREMSIQDFHHSLMLRYSLESVCERRQLCWSFEPYVDPDSPSLYSGSSYQTPPDDPWKITVHQIQDLEDLVFRLSTPVTPQPMTPLPPIVEAENGVEERDFFPDDQSSSEQSSLDHHQHNQSSSSKTSPKPTSLAADVVTVDPETRRNFQQKIFQDQCLEVTVPGTKSIHSCHVCAGVGRKRCIVCVGSGSTKCDMCDGVGYYGFDHHKSAFSRTLSGESSTSTSNHSDYCWRCRGRGRLRCDGCTGVGMTACVACAGTGQIKCFIKMIVTLTNHHNSVIIRDHHTKEIPFDQVKTADGHTVLDEDGLNLCPPRLDQLIAKESIRLIRLHRKRHLRNSKLIWQRHRIIAIPVVKVTSTWHGNRFHFYVFGNAAHRKCFVVDYPQRCCMLCCCCCCCSIL